MAENTNPGVWGFMQEQTRESKDKRVVYTPGLADDVKKVGEQARRSAESATAQKQEALRVKLREAAERLQEQQRRLREVNTQLTSIIDQLRSRKSRNMDELMDARGQNKDLYAERRGLQAQIEATIQGRDQIQTEMQRSIDDLRSYRETSDAVMAEALAEISGAEEAHTLAMAWETFDRESRDARAEAEHIYASMNQVNDEVRKQMRENVGVIDAATLDIMYRSPSLRKVLGVDAPDNMTGFTNINADRLRVLVEEHREELEDLIDVDSPVILAEQRDVRKFLAAVDGLDQEVSRAGVDLRQQVTELSQAYQRAMERSRIAADQTQKLWNRLQTVLNNGAEAQRGQANVEAARATLSTPEPIVEPEEVTLPEEPTETVVPEAKNVFQQDDQFGERTYPGSNYPDLQLGPVTPGNEIIPAQVRPQAEVAASEFVEEVAAPVQEVQQTEQAAEVPEPVLEDVVGETNPEIQTRMQELNTEFRRLTALRRLQAEASSIRPDNQADWVRKVWTEMGGNTADALIFDRDNPPSFEDVRRLLGENIQRLDRRVTDLNTEVTRLRAAQERQVERDAREAARKERAARKGNILKGVGQAFAKVGRIGFDTFGRLFQRGERPQEDTEARDNQRMHDNAERSLADNYADLQRNFGRDNGMAAIALMRIYRDLLSMLNANGEAGLHPVPSIRRETNADGTSRLVLDAGQSGRVSRESVLDAAQKTWSAINSGTETVTPDTNATVADTLRNNRDRYNNPELVDIIMNNSSGAPENRPQPFVFGQNRVTGQPMEVRSIV